MARLTQAVIDRVAAQDRERFVWDDELSGFGVRVLASGRRSWVVQYRTGGRQRRISLGDVRVVHAAEARAKARELLAHRALGNDPQAARLAAR